MKMNKYYENSFHKSEYFTATKFYNLFTNNNL